MAKKKAKAKTQAREKVDSRTAVLCAQSFREARGDLERPKLTLAGIVRGRRTSHSTTDWKVASVRREAEDRLRYVAVEEGCTHVYGCKIIEVKGLDRNYGKCEETFYIMEGDGYAPAGGK